MSIFTIAQLLVLFCKIFVSFAQILKFKVFVTLNFDKKSFGSLRCRGEGEGGRSQNLIQYVTNIPKVANFKNHYHFCDKASCPFNDGKKFCECMQRSKLKEIILPAGHERVRS